VIYSSIKEADNGSGYGGGPGATTFLTRYKLFQGKEKDWEEGSKIIMGILGKLKKNIKKKEPKGKKAKKGNEKISLS
jgi:hypothetical protein